MTDSRSLAEERLNAFVEKGRARAEETRRALLDEARRRENYVVPMQNLGWAVKPPVLNPETGEWSGEKILAVVNDGNRGKNVLELTHHAESQLFSALAPLPVAMVDGLIMDENPAGPKVLEFLLNALTYRVKSERRLLRAVGNELRGFLSDSYKMTDRAAVLKTVFDLVDKNGAVLTGGILTDWQHTFDGIFPKVLEPWKSEHIVLGFRLRGGDYGDAADEIALYVNRLVCMNGMVGSTLFRQVHSGKSEWKVETGFRVSPKTEQLAARLNVSKMSDAIRFALSPNTRAKTLRAYQEAAEKKIIVKEVLRDAKKVGLSETDAEIVQRLVGSGDTSNEILPKTDVPESALRASQALAWIAQQRGGNLQIDLEEFAGKLVLPRFPAMLNEKGENN